MRFRIEIPLFCSKYFFYSRKIGPHVSQILSQKFKVNKDEHIGFHKSQLLENANYISYIEFHTLTLLNHGDMGTSLLTLFSFSILLILI